MSDQVGDEAYRHAEPFGGVAVNIQHLASAIDAPLVVIDRSLQIVFVGPVAEELFGRAADELIGTPLRSLLAGCFVRHGSPVIAAVERCMATGEIQSATTTLQTLRGPSRARLTMVPSPSDGQATGAILFFNIIDGGEMARYEDPKERLPWEAPETIEVDDLHAALDRELPHVVEVLDLDFAIAQLFYS
ncbi:MAG TPA: PAS domain-containing protein, partial [Methanomassiliicoccaceae archaeon]|nr:PAS domain-containing protein [Methanomassiliicoccaceae archaeon]